MDCEPLQHRTPDPVSPPEGGEPGRSGTPSVVIYRLTSMFARSTSCSGIPLPHPNPRACHRRRHCKENCHAPRARTAPARKSTDERIYRPCAAQSFLAPARHQAGTPAACLSVNQHVYQFVPSLRSRGRKRHFTGHQFHPVGKPAFQSSACATAQAFDHKTSVPTGRTSRRQERKRTTGRQADQECSQRHPPVSVHGRTSRTRSREIGRASCRERV